MSMQKSVVLHPLFVLLLLHLVVLQLLTLTPVSCTWKWSSASLQKEIHCMLLQPQQQQQLRRIQATR